MYAKVLRYHNFGNDLGQVVLVRRELGFFLAKEYYIF